MPLCSLGEIDASTGLMSTGGSAGNHSQIRQLLASPQPAHPAGTPDGTAPRSLPQVPQSTAKASRRSIVAGGTTRRFFAEVKLIDASELGVPKHLPPAAFEIITPQRTLLLCAESVASRDNWVSAIQQLISEKRALADDLQRHALFYRPAVVERSESFPDSMDVTMSRAYSDSSLTEPQPSLASDSDTEPGTLGKHPGPATIVQSGPFTAASAREITEPEYWHVDEEDVTVLEQLGKGSHGTVFKGKLWGSDVAVKQLSASEVTDEVLVSLKAEINVLSRLRHPNIVLYMGACTTLPALFIVTEWCERGNLFDLLHNPELPLSVLTLMHMALDAARGISWLHSRPQQLIHRDLKSSNLLVTRHFRVKLADFGVTVIRRGASSSQMDSGSHYGVQGTPQWMAPEVMEGQKYTEQVDVYSFGIVLCELVSRIQPFSDKYYRHEFIEAVLEEGEMPSIPLWCDTSRSGPEPLPPTYTPAPRRAGGSGTSAHGSISSTDDRSEDSTPRPSRGRSASSFCGNEEDFDVDSDAVVGPAASSFADDRFGTPAKLHLHAAGAIGPPPGPPPLLPPLPPPLPLTDVLPPPTLQLPFGAAGADVPPSSDPLQRCDSMDEAISFRPWSVRSAAGVVPVIGGVNEWRIAPGACTGVLHMIIEACLDRAPSSRPTFMQLIEFLEALMDRSEDDVFLQLEVPRLRESLAYGDPRRRVLAVREIIHIVTRASEAPEQCAPCLTVPVPTFSEFTSINAATATMTALSAAVPQLVAALAANLRVQDAILCTALQLPFNIGLTPPHGTVLDSHFRDSYGHPSPISGAERISLAQEASVLSILAFVSLEAKFPREVQRVMSSDLGAVARLHQSICHIFCGAQPCLEEGFAKGAVSSAGPGNAAPFQIQLTCEQVKATAMALHYLWQVGNEANRTRIIAILRGCTKLPIRMRIVQQRLKVWLPEAVDRFAASTGTSSSGLPLSGRRVSITLNPTTASLISGKNHEIWQLEQQLVEKRRELMLLTQGAPTPITPFIPTAPPPVPEGPPPAPPPADAFESDSDD